MRRTRRLLRALAWLTLALVGVVALALVASQTPWFRDWLRRTAMRQADRALEGQLVIGRLEGSLFTGVTLSDVKVLQDGAPVVSIDRVAVTYGLAELLSDARVIGHLRVEHPVVHAVRTPDGWNLGQLLRPRQPPRPGAPRPTFALPDITVVNGEVTVEGAGAEPAEAIPRRIHDLRFEGAVTSGGQTLAIDIRGLRFEAEAPDLTLQEAEGRLTNTPDGWQVDDLQLRTGESALTVDGALRRDAPDDPLTLALDVRGAPVSLPEVGRFLPAVASIDVRPEFTARVDGPLEAMRVDLQMTSPAGNVTGPVTLDLTGPSRAAAGTVEVADVDLARWIDSADAAGRITGQATFDLRFPSETPNVALDGTFRFVGPRASAYGYAATDVVANGRLQGRRIELDARAAAYGGRATTRGAIIRPSSPRDSVALSLAGRVVSIDLEQLPAELAVPPLDTSLTGTYTVEGPLPRIRLTTTLETSTVEGTTIEDGFTGSFDRAPSGYRFAAAGTVRDVDLPRLSRPLELPALDNPLLAGPINGTFRVEGVKTGDETPIALTASGEVRDTAVYGGRVPRMAVEATLQGDRLAVVANGQIADYDLAALTDVPALTGTLTGQVDARVTFTDLDDITFETVDVDGTVTLNQPTLLDVPFAQVTADVDVEDGVVEVRSLRGEGDGFTLTGQGPLALREDGVSDFSYRLEAASVVDPARIADLPLTGAVTTEGRITGPRSAFQATGTLTGTDVAYDGESIQAASAQGEYRVELPDLDPERLRVMSGITASDAVVGGLSLASVTGEVTYAPDLVGFDVTANDGLRLLTAEGEVALREGEQEVSLQALSVTRDDVRWTLASDAAPATVTVRPESLTVAPVALVNGSQRIELAGRIALTEAERHALDVEARAVDVGEVLHLAGQDVDGDGTVSLDATIGGTGRLPTVEGSLTATDGRFRGVPIAELRATVEDDNGAARVDAVLRQSEGASLTVHGRVPRTLFLPPDTTAVPTTIDDALDLSIRSNAVDLALAEGLTDQLRNLTGTAQLDLRLTNTGRVPVVTGDVLLNDAGFLVVETGVRYDPVNAVIAFENDVATIRTLSAIASNGEPLEASGQIGLRNARKGELSLAITGDGVRVLDNELGYLDLDASLKVSGTMYAPVVEGELLVADGRFELDQLLPRFALGAYATKADYAGIPTYAAADAPPVVPDILAPEVRDAEVIYATRPETPAETEAAANGDAEADADAPEMFVYEDMAMNIRVRIPDNLVLRGRGVEVGRTGIGDINVTMGGDFRVAKTPGDPMVLIGAVNTVRGTYAYQGRSFDIARDGQVLFRGDAASTANPAIDVTAERVIQGVEARVRIQGTVDDPRISLSSDPPLEQADVLALIVFNQPVNQLGTGQQNSLAERAGGIAAGLAVSPLAQALGNTLDVDLFDVETTDQAGRVSPAVVIGQQVNQHLFVKFRQQFGNQQVSQFLLEYRLADYLRLQANAAEGDGLSRGNRSLTQRIERYGADLVFYFAF